MGARIERAAGQRRSQKKKRKGRERRAQKSGNSHRISRKSSSLQAPRHAVLMCYRRMKRADCDRRPIRRNTTRDGKGKAKKRKARKVAARPKSATGFRD